MARMAILSGGAFGTALAAVLSRSGHDIKLHVREHDVYHLISTSGVNATYLSGVELDRDRIRPTRDVLDAVNGADYVVIAIPAQHAREVVRTISESLNSDATVIVTSKGMVVHGEYVNTMSDIAAAELSTNHICGLYGITFAHYIAITQGSAGISSMCVASNDKSVATDVAELFTQSNVNALHVYVSTDLRGAEFGGAMKNVYAITMGLLDGYCEATEQNDIVRHSMLNLCMMEFIKFGLAHGARLHTLIGPSGIGDMEACSTPLSRNYQYGRWYANLKLKRSPESAPHLHEGYDTLQAAKHLAKEYSVETPILLSTYDILFESADMRDIIPKLLRRLQGTVSVKETERFDGLVSDSIKHPPSRILPQREPTLLQVFLSYRFNQEGNRLMRAVKSVCELQNISVMTGESEGAQKSTSPIKKEIRQKIEKADFYICIFLKDDSDSHWLRDELTMALSKDKPVLIFVEDGTPENVVSQFAADHPRHQFNDENFISCLEKQLRLTVSKCEVK